MRLFACIMSNETVWCVSSQDDPVQFFREEVEEGVGVCSVYLKKVHYHTSLNDVSELPLQPTNKSCSDTGIISDSRANDHAEVINPFKPNDAKWLHFKVFRAILV